MNDDDEQGETTPSDESAVDDEQGETTPSDESAVDDEQGETTPSDESAVDGESVSSDESAVDGESVSSDESAVDGESVSSDEPEERAGLLASWFGSRTRLIALLVGVVFLVGVVYAAISGVSGGRGGAESAEAAVEELVVALSNEDIVAALNVMAPSEVGTLGDMYPRIVELAAENGAIEHENWLAGVDFEVVGLETRGTELYPGVALVVTRGSGVAVGVVGGLVGPFEGFGSGVVVVDVVEDGCGEVAGVGELGGVEELAGED